MTLKETISLRENLDKQISTWTDMFRNNIREIGQNYKYDGNHMWDTLYRLHLQRAHLKVAINAANFYFNRENSYHIPFLIAKLTELNTLYVTLNKTNMLDKDVKDGLYNCLNSSWMMKKKNWLKMEIAEISTELDAHNEKFNIKLSKNYDLEIA